MSESDKSQGYTGADRQSKQTTHDLTAGQTWAQIQSDYNDPNVGKKQARRRAVDQLRKEFHLVVERESEDLYRYDEETGVYEGDARRIIRERLDKTLEEHFTTGERNQIFHRLKSAQSIPADEFCGPDNMICVETGVLTLDDPSRPGLRAHDPKYHFRHRLPVRYDPDAECQKFKEFVGEVVHPDDREKLQEFAGYCLHHWGMPFNKALMLTGPEQSGKSTFLTVISKLLGTNNVANESLQRLANSRFATAQLVGKFANIRADLDSSAVNNVGLFKELAAGDPITVERKHQDPFDLDVTQKQLYATNRVPELDYTDDAFHERWIHVRFPETIPRDDRDGKLDQKLTTNDELAGVLNWTLEGYARLLDQNGFTNERTVEEKRDLWQSQGDSIDRFVDQVLVTDPDAEIPKKDVYDAYKTFCESRGELPEHKSTVTQRLREDHGIERRKRTVGDERVRCYIGIKFSGEPPIDSEEV